MTFTRLEVRLSVGGGGNGSGSDGEPEKPPVAFWRPDGRRPADDAQVTPSPDSPAAEAPAGAADTQGADGSVPPISSPPISSTETSRWPARDRLVRRRQALQEKTAGFAAMNLAALSSPPDLAGPHLPPAVPPAGTPAREPVVGWLVIVAGPGLGRSVEIASGANWIGAAADQSIRLPFGDPKIAAARHALIVFDPRSQRYFLQVGDSADLVYLDDQLLLAPVELHGGESILLGRTRLRFVALCGPDFSWS